ncbi:MAG: nucleoside hydrolase [Anaerolineae bacterium]|nr:nucleoside hydrolase [Anaerolineae bacterium]
MKRFVIDTDTGVDDAEALLMAFGHPDVTIEAIVSVAGNVGVDKTTPNVLKVLDAVGRDVPVYRGCDRALVFRKPNAEDAHGSDGLGDAGIPESARTIEAEHGVDALVRLANEHPGELTLVALGPLTNVALATRLDPDLPNKYRELVIMGGAVYAMGNTETRSAEFNIFYDPDAAHIVFSEWLNITMLSWEATAENPLTLEQTNTLSAISTPRGEFFHKITRAQIAMIRNFLGVETLFIPDPLAMAVAIEPERVITRSERHYVQLELSGYSTRGQTVVDWRDRLGKTANTTIVISVDMQRVYELMRQGLE